MPSAATVPFISGSTRSLKAEMKLRVNGAIILLAAPLHLSRTDRLAAARCRSQVEGAFGKQLFDLHAPRRESLLVGEADDRIEHGAIGFDAEGKRVVADPVARHRGILGSKEQRGRNLLEHFLPSECF